MALTKATYSMIEGAPVNIVDYGAVGDWNGVTGTDNTAAFQAALDACPEGGALVIPHGYFLFNKVSTTKSVRIVGQGFSNSLQAIFGDSGWADTDNFSGSILVSSNTSSDPSISMGVAGTNKIFQLENFMLVGAGSGNPIGIQLTRSVGTYVSNVLIANFLVGYDLINCQDGDYNKIASKGNRVGVRFGGNITSNQNVLVSPEIQSYDVYGIHVQQASLILCVGGVLQDGRGGGIGVKIESICNKNVFLGTWFESTDPTTYAVYDLGDYNSYDKCYFGNTGDRMYIGASSSYCKITDSVYDYPPPGPVVSIEVVAGAVGTKIVESNPSTYAVITDNGTNTLIQTSYQTDGALYLQKGINSTANIDVIGGNINAVNTVARKTFRVSNAPNATLVKVLDVKVANLTMTGGLRLTFQSLMSDNSASETVSFNVAITRIANNNLFAGASAGYGSIQINSGGFNIATALDVTSFTGAANADQILTIRASFTRSGGVSSGHFALVLAELLNFEATGLSFA